MDNLISFLEIPRVYTAIAEILATIVYIVPLRKNMSVLRFTSYAIFGASIILGIQLINGILPIYMWIPGMMTAMLAMYFYIYFLTKTSKIEAGYFFVRSFILAEFAAAFAWQVYYYLLYKGVVHNWVFASLLILSIYFAVFALAFKYDAKEKDDIHVTYVRKDLINALIIGFATFSINNISYVVDGPFVYRQFGSNLLYIRTLVDFAGLMMLFGWGEQKREAQLQYELYAMNDVLYKHYDQYNASKESIDIINRRYHDLKHQIHAIRQEENAEKREEFLSEIDEAIKVYESSFKTGNKILDTVLSMKMFICNDNGIRFSIIADGKLMDFMRVMDMTALFGNALDNAIESVMKVMDLDRRIIRLSIKRQNKFIVVHIENYFEHEIDMKNDLPITTKQDKYAHGFGVKSIKKIVEQYDGYMNIKLDGSWFVLNMVFPLVEEN